MIRKSLALALVLVTAASVMLAGLAVTAFATDNSSGTSSPGSTVTTTTSLGNNSTYFPFGGMGLITRGPGFGGGFKGHGRGFSGEQGLIQVSSAYNQTVNNILGNDSDVQNLISQGYTVTSIRPVVQYLIEGNGTITAQATTAVVTMQNGTSGYARINVDIANAKVTQIVNLTRTVIDKSAS